MIESISAITLATHNMSRAVRFYRVLGFEIIYGGENAAFTSFRAGTGYLNLIAQPLERNWSWWGRVIFYHSDVDALHANVIAAGYALRTRCAAGAGEASRAMGSNYLISWKRKRFQLSTGGRVRACYP